MEPGLSIRFLEADHRHRSVRRSVEGTALSYDLAAYHRHGSPRQLANTPVAPAALLLGLGRRKGASRHTFLATQGIYFREMNYGTNVKAASSRRLVLGALQSLVAVANAQIASPTPPAPPA